jgi:putative ABC transport system permease protein
MNPISRGIRNAFRNSIRTSSIVLILGLSIGLALTMLIAQKAVDNKINSVKNSIGNTISISPAGFSPGSQTNNALTTDQLDKIKVLGHVDSVTETLADRQATTGSSTPMFGRSNASTDISGGTTTSLNSPVTLNSDGPGRFFAGGNAGTNTDATAFSLPVSFLGTNDPTHVDATPIKISSGKTLNGTVDANDALISQAMADKNGLTVGSTFSAYNATLIVAGIFTTPSDNRGAENTVVVSLPALQRLSGQTSTVTSATITVDSLDNLSATTAAVKNTLGSSADITSAEEQAENAVKPLNSVKNISTFSMIGAILAGTIIILLVMIMVVRERRKEIGVTKAIGASNARIIGEFAVEAMVLAVMGATIGLFIGIFGGQPVTNQLVDSSSQSAASTTQGPGSRTFSMHRNDASVDPVAVSSPGGNSFRSFRHNTAIQGLTSVKTQIGPGVLLEGFGAAILIATLGSALASGMIAKIRPSEVLRSE